MADISFSARAYCKILLHTIKYPHCAVNGLLLARQKKGDGKSGQVQIEDVIPLFHICLHVSPMSEIALTMVDQVASSEGLVIAGYYLANENLNDVSTDKPAHRAISEKIADIYNNALLVVVDNMELIKSVSTNPLKVSQHNEGKWKTKDKSSIHYENELKLGNIMYNLMKSEEYRNIIDFDNHLDNIALDWRNLNLNDTIADVIESLG